MARAEGWIGACFGLGSPMRLLLRLVYEGSDLSGCPEQPGHRTVCGLLRGALQQLGTEPELVETLSRTDAGVHAVGNVGHVVIGRARSPAALLRGLDRHLPLDVRVTGVAPVEAPPRPGPKTYRYRIDLSPYGEAHRARFTWRPQGRAPSVEVLDPLAHALVGERDWSPFRRADETRDDLVRRVLDARWSDQGQERVFTIMGEGFPYRFVRAVVGGMLAAARREAPLADWRHALEHGGGLCRQTAPARGLCLEGVSLPGVTWTT
jgi:tRNA pseudouridine38-40 synthase